MADVRKTLARFVKRVIHDRPGKGRAAEVIAIKTEGYPRYDRIVKKVRAEYTELYERADGDKKVVLDKLWKERFVGILDLQARLVKALAPIAIPKRYRKDSGIDGDDSQV